LMLDFFRDDFQEVPLHLAVANACREHHPPDFGTHASSTPSNYFSIYMSLMLLRTLCFPVLCCTQNAVFARCRNVSTYPMHIKITKCLIFCSVQDLAEGES
jgi:hypothetical protein